MPTHELANHLLILATLRLLTLNSHTSRFQHVRAIPLQVLSELTERYLALLATTAKRYAEQSGRTQANAADVVLAMQDFGQNLDEVWEWCEERRLGDEGNRMAASGGVAPSSLGALLKDSTRTTAVAEALEGSSIIQYAPLSEFEDQQEEALKAGLITLPASRERSATPDAPLKGSRSPSLPPPSYAAVVQEDSDCALEVLYQPPPDLLAFLPPLPDLTASASVQAIQTVTVEDETTGASRTVKRTRRTYAGSNTAAMSRSVWRKQVTFDGSQLAEYSTRPLPEFSAENALSRMYDEVQAAQGARPASSLASFLETYNHIVTEANGQDPLPLRHNAKRRRAATAIQSNILINPSDDSLSGAVPTPQVRSAKKHAGWIPFPPVGEREDPSEPGGKAVLPFPPLHAFNTSLPPTVSESVPGIMLPHATATVVPSMHPRYPTAHASIRTLLAAASPALFSRTTRMGPPGPLLETGATGHYEVELEKPNIPGAVGGAFSRMMAYSFDWEVGRETDDAVPALKKAEAARIAAASGLPPASAAPTPAVMGAPTPAAISAPTPSAAIQAATPAPILAQLGDMPADMSIDIVEPAIAADGSMLNGTAAFASMATAADASTASLPEPTMLEDLKNVEPTPVNTETGGTMDTMSQGTMSADAPIVESAPVAAAADNSTATDTGVTTSAEQPLAGSTKLADEPMQSTTETLTSLDPSNDNDTPLASASGNAASLATDSQIPLTNGHTAEDTAVENPPIQPSIPAIERNGSHDQTASVHATSRNSFTASADAVPRAQSTPRADSTEVFAAPSPLKISFKFKRSISRPLSVSSTPAANEVASPQRGLSVQNVLNDSESGAAPSATSDEPALPGSSTEAATITTASTGALALENGAVASARLGDEAADLKALFGAVPPALEDSAMEDVTMAELNPSLVAKAEIESPAVPFTFEDAQGNVHGNPFEEVKPAVPVETLPAENLN